MEVGPLRSNSANSTRLRPVAFAVGEQQVAAMLHLPPAGKATTAGAVLCPPLGRDNIFAHRPLHALARALAAAGVAVLHFDWPGYGDSTGDPADAGIADAWIDSVGVAVRVLRLHAGCTDTTVVGTKIGATIALEATVRHGPICDLVIWSADLSGRAYLRELAAFSAFAGGEAGGFPLGEEAASFLRRLDLLEGPLPDLRGRRTLVIGADGSLPDERLVKRLETAGASVSVRRGNELDTMLNSVTTVPTATIAAVKDWIGPGAPIADAGGMPETSVIRSNGPRRSLGIVEETTFVETDHGRVVVVTCAPENVAGGQTWVAFGSTAQIRRMGPSRMWTNFARTWAEQGIPSLRFDVHGVGDSDGPAASSADLRTQYSAEAVATARAALEHGRARHDAGGFSLVGLCSGATTALELAVSEQDIQALALINVQLFSIADERLRQLRRNALRASILRREDWASILRADDAARRRVVSVISRARSAVRVGRSGAALGTRRTSLEALSAALAMLERGGVPVMFVYSDPDDGLDIARALPGGLDWLERWRNVAVEVVPGAGHTFIAADGRDRLLQILTRHLAADRPGSGTRGRAPGSIRAPEVRPARR